MNLNSMTKFKTRRPGITCATALVSLLAISGQVLAQDETRTLPVQELHPGAQTEEQMRAAEQLQRAKQQQGAQQVQGTPIVNGRAQFGGDIFGARQASLPNSQQSLSRELMVAENPELDGYVDAFGRPAGGAKEASPATNPIFEKVKAQYKPEQDYDLKPGQNKAVPVGVGLLNSIQTNFEAVEVKMTDQESIIETDGGNIFITPNTLKPVSLIIFEAGVMESQVSLVLVPGNTPPAMVDVDVTLNKDMVDKGRAYREQVSKRNDEARAELDRMKAEAEGRPQSGHTRKIIDTLRPVAQGRIPTGFTITNKVPKAYERPCQVPIEHHTGQRLNGGKEVVDVVLMYNDTNRPFQVREEMCLSEDAIAVAIFNASYLQPGQDTEVYILRNKTYFEDLSREQNRPRLSRPRLSKGGQ